jgi:hypothetical protein
MFGTASELIVSRDELIEIGPCRQQHLTCRTRSKRTSESCIKKEAFERFRAGCSNRVSLCLCGVLSRPVAGSHLFRSPVQEASVALHLPSLALHSNCFERLKLANNHFALEQHPKCVRFVVDVPQLTSKSKINTKNRLVFELYQIGRVQRIFSKSSRKHTHSHSDAQLIHGQKATDSLKSFDVSLYLGRTNWPTCSRLFDPDFCDIFGICLNFDTITVRPTSAIIEQLHNDLVSVAPFAI